MGAKHVSCSLVLKGVQSDLGRVGHVLILSFSGQGSKRSLFSLTSGQIDWVVLWKATDSVSCVDDAYRYNVQS